jgi:S-DNA-T family DNA segregation ATPase FtsK/SpoIIIE
MRNNKGELFMKKKDEFRREFYLYRVTRPGQEETVNEESDSLEKDSQKQVKRGFVQEEKVYDISKYTGMRVVRPLVSSTSFKKGDVSRPSNAPIVTTMPFSKASAPEENKTPTSTTNDVANSKKDAMEDSLYSETEWVGISLNGNESGETKFIDQSMSYDDVTKLDSEKISQEETKIEEENISTQVDNNASFSNQSSEEQTIQDSSDAKDEEDAEPVKKTAPDQVGPSKEVKNYAQNVINNAKAKEPVKKTNPYVGPTMDFLAHTVEGNENDIEEADRQKEIIDSTFKKSQVGAHVDHYIFGPTVTQFFISIDDGENVRSISKCKDNLTMYLAKERIRILTPIPGQPYGGIEVPKEDKYRRTVWLGDLLDCEDFKKSKMILPAACGRDNYGKNIYIDFTEMPHGLVAGTTKSGKSVCLNCFIMSLLYKYSPSELRLILVDPKAVEFSIYEGIPHLEMPVVTEEEDFQGVLEWIYQEMERRYRLMGRYSEKVISSFNKYANQNHVQKLPYIVMIMDEFSDWFADASAEVELYMQKLVAKARAAGIHIILATQRPSKDVIKGTIKANFDTRIAFKVSSYDDSKIILGGSGAENLQGHGDMLLRYGGSSERRLQGCYVSDDDIKRTVIFLRNHNIVDYMVTKEELHQSSVVREMAQQKNDGATDEQFAEIAYYVVRNRLGSNNAIVHEFNMGYNRANDIFSALERLGIVGPAVHGKAREVLVTEMELEDILKNENISQ